MIHIVFNAAEVELMKNVIEADETLTGEVVQIKDDYAVGPLQHIDTDEGWQARLDWWNNLLTYSHYELKDMQQFDDRDALQILVNKLQENPEEQLWIWMGQNQHDVCGYFRMISFFKPFQGRVSVLYMNNLPFINDKGQLFYPSWLHEIPVKEFLKAKKLARPVTLSEFEIDPDEWKKICEENASVRILEGGKKIIGKDETFFDAEILRNVTADWQKAWRLVSNTLHRMKIKTGDVFIEWRIKMLIVQGKIETMGDLSKGWKDFDLKLTVSNTKQLIDSTETDT